MLLLKGLKGAMLFVLIGHNGSVALPVSIINLTLGPTAKTVYFPEFKITHLKYPGYFPQNIQHSACRDVL